MTAASDLNYASIAIGDLPGRQAVTRRVTNITQRVGVYEATVEAPAGVAVKVSPSRLVIPPGRTASFTVTFTRTNAALNQWAFGALTWKDKKGHQVSRALAVRPVAVAVTGEVVHAGTSGSAALPSRPATPARSPQPGSGCRVGRVQPLPAVLFLALAVRNDVSFLGRPTSGALSLAVGLALRS